jgi:hypothetical protein
VADFVMSHHALERAVDMAVTADEIRACWDNPLDQHWSPKHNGWVISRGRITLGVRETDSLPVVTTVMWSTPAGYASDLEHGTLTGRSAEDMKKLRAVRRAKKKRGHR